MEKDDLVFPTVDVRLDTPVPDDRPRETTCDLLVACAIAIILVCGEHTAAGTSRSSIAWPRRILGIARDRLRGAVIA